jgi:hypothetical protein
LINPEYPPILYAVVSPAFAIHDEVMSLLMKRGGGDSSSLKNAENIFFSCTERLIKENRERIMQHLCFLIVQPYLFFFYIEFQQTGEQKFYSWRLYMSRKG